MYRWAISVFAIAFAVQGCGEAVRTTGDNVGTPAEIKTIYQSCYDARGERQAMFAAAMAGARSADYAARSKAAAEACSQARRDLVAVSSQQPCIPLLITQEAAFWALNSIFEGRAGLEAVQRVNLPTDEETRVCAHSMGITDGMMEGTEPAA